MSTLHITNGDAAADKLRRAVAGPVAIVADVLHDGPAPRVEGDAWHDVRARFLASGGDTTHEAVKKQLASWDRAIADACRPNYRSASLSGERPEIVLWFEHDLFDQLLLIRTLDLLVRLTADTTYEASPYVVSGFPPPLPLFATELRRGQAEAQRAKAGSRTVPRVSLICIDRFPGVERFVGLGQLTPDQFAALIGTERPVTSEQYALASEAWEAFRSPDPTELPGITVRLLAPRSSAGKPDTTSAGQRPVTSLPFLRDALLRFFAEFPSVANGLSRTEELALGALCDGGMNGGALFVATQAQEERPFMGDSSFFRTLRALGSARVPLVTMSGGPEELDLRSHGIAITDAGREVLAGRSDHIALNGIDIWRGGVHLAGREASPWRWDARSETLVS